MRRTRSTASIVFGILVVAFALIASAFTLYLVAESQHNVRTGAERVTRAVAGTITATLSTRSSLTAAESPDLQEYAERTMRDAHVDFVTIMIPDGTRLTHANPENIGKPYLGTIPTTANTLTEEYVGTLGPSVRTISPIMNGTKLIGWVSVGVTVSHITGALVERLPFAIICFVAIVAIGSASAVVARRMTRRVTGTLPPGRVHDAVHAYESIRPLGEALRRQTHEHGNRMHTVIALLELGRTDQAIEMLAETGTQNQALIDHIAFPGEDPTAAALLLQKSAAARDLGVSWTADIIPASPPLPFNALETVSVLGNLIDNAIEAAANGPEPAWVNVRLGPATSGGVRIVVRDSGTGIPAGHEDQIFEHGYSTKSGNKADRGVGLALVRELVTGAGGTITFSNKPTTALVLLPEART